MTRFTQLTVAALITITCCPLADAATMTFFDPSQVATLVTEGTTWDKIRSNGYYFTYTRDKLFTGGGSVPIGRYVRVPWPQGIEAQAVTAGPNPGKAKITVERVDGDIFDFTAFTAKLLANTGGAGGSFEVVPFLNGEEVLPDPVMFDASGYAGNTFSYDTSSNPWGSTAPLTGYDKYTIDLYVDFALIGLTFTGAPIPGPPGDYNGNGIVDAADFVVWRTTDGTPEDYMLWRSHFGETAGAGAATSSTASSPIPETHTIALLLAGTILLYLPRSKQWWSNHPYEPMSMSPTDDIPQIRAVDDWVPWLAGLLQLIAAIGWLCAWIVVASVNAGLINAFPEGEARESWQYSFWFGFFNVNAVAVIFGWPLCFVVAWIRYFRSTQAYRRQLLLFTSLPYVHALLLVISWLLLAVLNQYLDLGL